jgi:F5/8 type C domain
MKREVGGLLLVAVMLCFAGCGSQPVVQKKEEGPKETVRQKEKNGAHKSPESKNEDWIVKKLNLAVAWKALAAEVGGFLAAGKLEEAQQGMEKLDKVYTGSEKKSAEQTEEFQALELKLAEARKSLLDIKRESNLALAEKHMNFGKFEEAQQLIGDVVAHNPTPQQHEKATAIKDEIERRRRAKRDLQAYMNMLASANRREVEAAQFELLKDPETSLSLLAEASQRTDKPVLASNAVETLGLLDRPQQAQAILVEILRRDTQQPLWAVATKEIIRMGKPGAGEPLLALAMSEVAVEQKMAALETLAQVSDPPPQTLVSLLPTLHADGPLLRLALAAALHGAMTHSQFDLVSRRGFEGELTPQQEEQLDKLSERLAALAAPKDPAASGAADVARAAQSLAVALRYLPAAPLTGLKIHLVEAEVPEAPAAAVLDGIWNSIDPRTMWRHGIEKRGSITLDLGSERTVTAVKIWNFNEPAGMFRGWKDFEIFVGNSPSESTPIAAGIVPQAPGAADTHDYGSVMSVPFIRGRYIRLQAKGPWQPNSHMGLSEVQVLGF